MTKEIKIEGLDKIPKAYGSVIDAIVKLKELLNNIGNK